VHDLQSISDTLAIVVHLIPHNTAVLPKIPHCNSSKSVPNRPLWGRRGRFGTLLQQLECGIFGRTAVRGEVRLGPRRTQQRRPYRSIGQSAFDGPCVEVCSHSQRKITSFLSLRMGVRPSEGRRGRFPVREQQPFRPDSSLTDGHPTNHSREFLDSPGYSLLHRPVRSPVDVTTTDR